MIETLNPYPAMKNSGVPWLGEVPEHWEVGTLRRRLRPYDGIKIGPFGSQLKLDQMSDSGHKVYGQANVIARDFNRGRKFIDHNKFNELAACDVRPGDLVVTMMGTSGRCARVPDSAVSGIMDSHLLRLRTTAAIDVRFAAKIIDEAPYVKEQIAVAGKGSIMHGLNSSMIKDLVLTLPPLPEQAAIVRFLDHADRRIRRYIRAKQKLIKVLEEQKQAIIHRAVTRGLDPGVRLKPSGVEWLGDVPEHWQKLPGRSCFAEKRTPNTGLRETTVLSLSYGQIVVKPPEKLHGLVPASFETYQIIEPHDIVIRPTDLQNDWNSLRFGFANTRGIITSAYMCFRTRELLQPEFGYLLLHTYDLKKIFYGLGSGLRQNLDWYDFKYLPCTIPPLPEQAAIVRFLDEVTTDLKTVINRAQREITLFREYRTRLIADVVTGKLDVREAAARLPDEADEAEPLDDEADALSDAEEETAVVDEPEE